MANFKVGDRVRVEYDGMLFDGAIYIGMADNNRNAQFECDGDRLEAPFDALTLVTRALYPTPAQIEALELLLRSHPMPSCLDELLAEAMR